jgi:multidrug efflux pump subunit AcrA (membrane-fusion protein)
LGFARVALACYPPMQVRRPSLPVAALALLAAGGVAAAVLAVGPEETVSATQRTTTVRKGVVQVMVSGSGNLAPSKQLDVDFGAEGKVTHVYVEAGDRVTKGELLARLDRTSAEATLAQAQAELTDAVEQLDTAQSDAATASADATATGSSAAATATAARSAATFRVAAGATPAPSASPAPSPTPAPSATATPSPTPAPRATATPAPAAESQDSSPSGDSSGMSVAAAEAAVAGAQVEVQEAEDALAATDLRAPMAGTVASVSGAVGDAVGSTSAASADAEPFVVLARLSRLKLDVSLAESDIGKVKVGQRATVTVNAASGEQFSAHVTSVSVLSSATEDDTGTGGAVSYPVTVVLDQHAASLRAGMSATADIVTAQASGLVVPNQALSGSTVTVERDGVRTTARVQTGLAGDSATQIVGGLEEGDEVVVTSRSATAGGTTDAGAQQQERSALGGGAQLGGGGGFGGGGAGPPGAVLGGGGPPGGP